MALPTFETLSILSIQVARSNGSGESFLGNRPVTRNLVLRGCKERNCVERAWTIFRLLLSTICPDGRSLQVACFWFLSFSKLIVHSPNITWRYLEHPRHGLSLRDCIPQSGTRRHQDPSHGDPPPMHCTTGHVLRRMLCRMVQ